VATTTAPRGGLEKAMAAAGGRARREVQGHAASPDGGSTLDDDWGAAWVGKDWRPHEASPCIRALR